MSVKDVMDIDSSHPARRIFDRVPVSEMYNGNTCTMLHGKGMVVVSITLATRTKSANQNAEYPSPA
jgi:hypothetical protein